VVSTRFPMQLRSGGLERDEALRAIFVGVFAPRCCGGATFSESTLSSVSQLLSATISWKGWAAGNFGAWAMCRATGRATDGAWSGKDRW